MVKQKVVVVISGMMCPNLAFILDEINQSMMRTNRLFELAAYHHHCLTNQVINGKAMVLCR